MVIKFPQTDHDALHMKKLEPVDMDLSSLLPEITPNYRPLGSYLENSISQTRNKATADYEALSAVISSRNQRYVYFSISIQIFFVYLPGNTAKNSVQIKFKANGRSEK